MAASGKPSQFANEAVIDQASQKDVVKENINIPNESKLMNMMIPNISIFHSLVLMISKHVELQNIINKSLIKNNEFVSLIQVFIIRISC